MNNRIFLMSILFLTIMHAPLMQASFTDTAEDSLLYFQSHGIIQGYEDGSFRPNAPINRAEFMKILVENAHMSNAHFTPHCFSDIEAGAWYEKYVCIGKELQMVEGYSDGTFRPGNEVTNAEALKMVIGTLAEEQKKSLSSVTQEKKEIQEALIAKYSALQTTVPAEVKNNPPFTFTDVTKDAWYYSYVVEGWRTGLIDTVKKFHPNTASTRGAVMEMLFRDTLNSKMPHYTNCAQSFTLASCARDFFTIEHAISSFPIEEMDSFIQTSSGITFGVMRINSHVQMELSPLFIMEQEFGPEYFFALVKEDKEGHRTHTWWKEDPASHHEYRDASLYTIPSGELYMKIRSYDYNAEFGNTSYYIEQDTLRKVPLAG